MITEAIIDFFLLLFAGCLHLIPALTFDTSGFTSSMAALKGIIEPAAYFLPLADIAAVIGIILAYQAGTFLIWAFNWVVRRIADIIP